MLEWVDATGLCIKTFQNSKWAMSIHINEHALLYSSVLLWGLAQMVHCLVNAVVKVSRGPPGPGPGSSNYRPFWPRLLVGGPRLLLQTQSVYFRPVKCMTVIHRLRMFLANVVRYMLSPVCLSSVTFVHPTQPVEIFGNISSPFGTLAIR